MKKIIFGLLIAFVALSFMGCPTAHEDAEWSVLTPGYLSGSITEWAQNDTTKINWVIGAGIATASFDFTVSDPNNNAFLAVDEGWNNKFAAALEVGKDFVALEPGAPNGDGTIKGLAAGTYTFMFESDSSTVKAKVVKK